MFDTERAETKYRFFRLEKNSLFWEAVPTRWSDTSCSSYYLPGGEILVQVDDSYCINSLGKRCVPSIGARGSMVELPW